MKNRIALVALLVAIAQPALAERGAAYWANVDASFANLLNHEPYAGPTQTTVDLDRVDPVATMLHAMVRETGRVRVERAAFGDDGAGAGFSRMLSHTAYAGPTGVTVPRTLDHRVDRLVLALRHMHQEPLRLAATDR